MLSCLLAVEGWTETPVDVLPFRVVWHEMVDVNGRYEPGVAMTTIKYSHFIYYPKATVNLHESSEFLNGMLMMVK